MRARGDEIWIGAGRESIWSESRCGVCWAGAVEIGPAGLHEHDAEHRPCAGAREGDADFAGAGPG